MGEMHRIESGEEVRVVLITAPDPTIARRLALGLVEARLAACVNLVDDVRSVYRWEGRVEEEVEVLMLVKTSAQRLPELGSWIEREHPYDTMEFIALRPEEIEGRYAAWLLGALAREGDAEER